MTASANNQQSKALNNNFNPRTPNDYAKSSLSTSPQHMSPLLLSRLALSIWGQSQVIDSYWDDYN